MGFIIIIAALILAAVISIECWGGMRPWPQVTPEKRNNGMQEYYMANERAKAALTQLYGNWECNAPTEERAQKIRDSLEEQLQRMDDNYNRKL